MSKKPETKAQGKRRAPIQVDPKLRRRPKEKPIKPKPTDERAKTPEQEDEEELAAMAEMAKKAQKISPGRLLMEKFLAAYLRTHNILDAARAILPPDLRKDKAHVRKLAWKMWRSRPFQRLLDEHLEEFGKKTKRLKRMTLMVLERAMVEDRGLGSHGANVKAADVMSRIMGMQEKKVSVKNTGLSTNLLVVPGIAALDDWEAAAQKAQDELKRRTRALHQSVEDQQEDIDEE